MPSALPVVYSRPRRVAVVSILLIVFGCLGVLLGLVVVALLGDAANDGREVRGVVYAVAWGQLALSVLQVVSGAFLWPGRSWARVLAVVVCGVSLLGAVYTLLFGSPLQGVLGVVFNAVLIRLLLHVETRAWCVPRD